LTLLNCYDSLVTNQIILANSNRLDLFKRLNTQRNLLLVTHHLGSMSSSVKNLLTEVTTELKAIGGSSWDQSSVAAKSLFELKAHNFFELSNGLMGTLVQE